MCICFVFFFFFQAEDGIRDVEGSRGLGDLYKGQGVLLLEITRQPNLGGGAQAGIGLDGSGTSWEVWEKNKNIRAGGASYR